MAKKKASKQQQQQQQQQEKKPHEITMEDPLEKLANLKSLNALLVKETVERRQQVESLIQSKEALESEISRSLLEKQRLESEKNFLEDETIVAELEQSLNLAFVSSQLNQQAESFRNEIRRADEDTKYQISIFKAKLEEKINDKEKSRKAATEKKLVEKQIEIDQISEDFRRYRDEVREDLNLKDKESDGLRSTVVELDKSNSEAVKEIGRIQMERDEVRQEMERMYQDLKREIEGAVRERDEIEAVRKEEVFKIDSLKKSVDALTSDLSSERELSNRVVREKDQIQLDVDAHIEEIKGLRSILVELEKNSSETSEELRQLQTQNKLLSEDKENIERSLASLERDKDSLERSLKLSSQQIEGLKREITQLTAEKQKIQNERTQQVVNITELQKEVAQLIATVSGLQKEEQGLKLKISELRRSNEDTRDKQEQLLKEFNALVEERKERERMLDELTEEKFSAMQSFKESLNKLEEQERKIQEIGLDKAEIDKVKIKLEAEIFDLRDEMSKLRATVSALQESCRKHEENNTQLQSEAIKNRNAFDLVVLERDDALKLLDKEKNELSRLRLKILELEKNVEETQEGLAQLCTERDCLVEEKKEKETSLQLLIEEKASLQKALEETQQGLEDLQVKMTSTNKWSEKTLSMLKGTVAIVGGSVEERNGNGEASIDAVNNEVEIQPFAAELEVINRAFRDRESKVEYLSQQLKSIEKSAMEAKKRKSFWTLLSSATIFAAASVVYVARGR